jgi:hypothetical protein
MQFVFIWLVPIVGPIIAISILRMTNGAQQRLVQSHAPDDYGTAGMSSDIVSDHFVGHGGSDGAGGHGGH